MVHILTLKTGIHLLVKLLFISKAMSETHYCNTIFEVNNNPWSVYKEQKCYSYII